MLHSEVKSRRYRKRLKRKSERRAVRFNFDDDIDAEIGQPDPALAQGS